MVLCVIGDAPLPSQQTGFIVQSISKQIESNAIAAYVQHGVRISIPLSAGARRELVRIKRSIAGLQELQAVLGMVREPFESNTAYHMRQLKVRTAVRAQYT